MSDYEPEPLTVGHSEAPQLSAAVEREHYRIANAFRTAGDLAASPEVPNPAEGMVRYYDAAQYDPGRGTGLYVYRAGRWRLLDEAPQSAQLYGEADSFALGTTIVYLGNYGTVFQSEGAPELTVDAVAGTVTVTAPGWIEVTGAVTGVIGSNTQNEAYRFWLNVYDDSASLVVDELLDVRDRATNKTAEASVMGYRGLSLEANDIVALGMNATAGLGTFDVTRASFRVDFWPT